MYSNKFVAVIKVNGRVLRENNGEVRVPFGSEYSLLLKNLNSVRVMAKISVDGQDATEGTWLVLGPNSNSEIERFIKNGNLSTGNRFKFIERSPAVEAHRGIGAEDGLVRIEFKTERILPPPPVYRPSQPYWPPRGRRSGDRFGLERRWGASGSSSRSLGSFTQASVNVNSAYTVNSSTATGSLDETSVCGGAAAAGPAPEPAPAGITVQGGVSNQTFVWTESFAVHEPGEVIVLRLVGEVGGQQVTQPVTVDYKPKCTSCGLVNRANSKFCSQCGTGLVLI